MTLNNASTAYDAVELAAEIRSRRRSAASAVSACLESISRADRELNCFTAVMEDEAVGQAPAIDARIAAGEDPGPLAGVPFAVKNRVDVRGLTTLAGSKINVIARLKQAGVVLARSWWALSTWTSTPTVSRPKTRTTGRHEIPTIWNMLRASRRSSEPCGRWTTFRWPALRSAWTHTREPRRSGRNLREQFD